MAHRQARLVRKEGQCVANHKYDFYFSETGGCECQAPEMPARLVMGGWPARGTVYENDRLSIGYTRCRPVSDGMGPEIRSGISVLAFPTRGLFRMHIRNETHVACKTFLTHSASRNLIMVSVRD